MINNNMHASFEKYIFSDSEYARADDTSLNRGQTNKKYHWKVPGRFNGN